MGDHQHHANEGGSSSNGCGYDSAGGRVIPSHMTQVRIVTQHRPDDFMGGAVGRGPERGPGRKLSSNWIKVKQAVVESNQQQQQEHEEALSNSSKVLHNSNKDVSKASTTAQNSLSSSSISKNKYTTNHKKEAVVDYSLKKNGTTCNNASASLHTIDFNASSASLELEKLHNNRSSIHIHDDDSSCSNSTCRSNDKHDENGVSYGQSLPYSATGMDGAKHKSEDHITSSSSTSAKTSSNANTTNATSKNSKNNNSERSISHLTPIRALDYGDAAQRPDDFMGGCGVGPASPRRKLRATPSWLSSSNTSVDLTHNTASSSNCKLNSSFASAKSNCKPIYSNKSKLNASCSGSANNTKFDTSISRIKHITVSNNPNETSTSQKMNESSISRLDDSLAASSKKLSDASSSNNNKLDASSTLCNIIDDDDSCSSNSEISGHNTISSTCSSTNVDLLHQSGASMSYVNSIEDSLNVMKPFDAANDSSGHSHSNSTTTTTATQKTDIVGTNSHKISTVPTTAESEVNKEEQKSVNRVNDNEDSEDSSEDESYTSFAASLTGSSASLSASLSSLKYQNDGDDDDDDDDEAQKYSKSVSSFGSQNTLLRHSMTQVRKLDDGGGRPDDFMGGCGNLVPAPVRRKTVNTPSWLSSLSNTQGKEESHKSSSRTLTPAARPTRTRSFQRSKETSSGTNKTSKPSVSRSKSYEDGNSKALRSSMTRLKDDNKKNRSSLSIDYSDDVDASESTNIDNDLLFDTNNTKNTKSSSEITSRSIVDCDDDSTEESEDEHRSSIAVVAVQKWSKPGDFVGGCGIKQDMKSPNSNDEPKRRGGVGRTYSYTRPTDFMGGGGIAALNTPRKKTIDPNSIFGNKN